MQKLKMATNNGRKTIFGENRQQSLQILCRSKLRQNWEKSPVDSADTVRGKNSVKITISRTVLEINVFLHFTQKFKMAAKNGRKTIFGKVSSKLCRSSVEQKFRQNRCISHHFEDRCVFAFLRRNSRWLPNMAGKQFSGKLASVLCRYPVGKKFR